MFIDIFEFDGNQLVLNKPEVLLIKEFGNVWNDVEYNKCKEDKTGKKHLKAEQLFKFIWLAYDYKSNYQELTEKERIETALNDAGLTEKDIVYGMAAAAVYKYQTLQDTRLLKMLRTANKSLDKVDEFLNSMNLQEKDEKGNYVHSVSDVFKQLGLMGQLASSLKDLEYQVKKEKDAEQATRGEDTQEGFFD